jgi:hypothetical protein
MWSFVRGVLVVAIAMAGIGLERAVAAVAGQGTPAPGTSPSAVPSAAPSSDPCGGRDRLLATLNRPTVGYSACAVPPGAIVLEEGYQNQSQAGASPNVTTSYPQGFERFGIGGGFEADVIGPNDNRSRSGSAVTTGYNDFGLGFKYELPQRGRFTYGLDGLFTAATGTAGFTAGRPTQIGNLDVSYAASPTIAFGTTIADSSAGYLLPSVVVSAQIPHDYQFYIELVAQTKLVPQGGGRIFTDFGVQKLVGQNVELDLEYADSFTPVDGSRFHYVGIGTGIRVK